MKLNDDTPFLWLGSVHFNAAGDYEPDRNRYPFAPLKPGEVFLKLPPVPMDKGFAKCQKNWLEKSPAQRRKETRADLRDRGIDPDTGRPKDAETKRHKNA